MFVSGARALVEHAVRIGSVNHLVECIECEHQHEDDHEDGANRAEERLVRIVAFVVYCYRYAKLVIPRNILLSFLNSFPALFPTLLHIIVFLLCQCEI